MVVSVCGLHLSAHLRFRRACSASPPLGGGLRSRAAARRALSPLPSPRWGEAPPQPLRTMRAGTAHPKIYKSMILFQQKNTNTLMGLYGGRAPHAPWGVYAGGSPPVPPLVFMGRAPSVFAAGCALGAVGLCPPGLGGAFPPPCPLVYRVLLYW